MYRITRHVTTGVSTCTKFWRREMRRRMHLLAPELEANIMHKQAVQSQLMITGKSMKVSHISRNLCKNTTWAQVCTWSNSGASRTTNLFGGNSQRYQLVQAHGSSEGAAKFCHRQSISGINLYSRIIHQQISTII